MSFIDDIKKVEIKNQIELVRYYKFMVQKISLFFTDDLREAIFDLRKMLKGRHTTI